MPSLTLYIGNKNYSSWSLRGWLALGLAGAKFEEVVIPLRRPESVETIGRATPPSRVPALHWNHDDGSETEVLWDSLAIGETLAERYPDRNLWPSAPRTRAHARSITAEMHAGFMALRSRLPMNLRRRPSAVQPDGECGGDIARILEIWNNCRSTYARDSAGEELGPFLFGEPTLADAAFAPVATRFRSYDIGMDDLATAYVETIHRWPLMRDWIEDAANETWRIESMEA